MYLPPFDGGRLRQRLALSEHGQKAALAYRQTVLRAWHEVDHALDALAAQQEQHADLLVAHEQHRRALHVAERAYQQGAADYLGVLTASSGTMIPVLMMAALKFLLPPVRLYGLALYAMSATFAPNLSIWLAGHWADGLADWRRVYWQVIPLALDAALLVGWGLPREAVRAARFRQANWPGMACGVPALGIGRPGRRAAAAGPGPPGGTTAVPGTRRCACRVCLRPAPDGAGMPVGRGAGPDWHGDQFLVAQALHAAGQPMAIIALLFLVTSVVQPREGPYASGTVDTLRALGSRAGAALVGQLVTVRGRYRGDMLLDRAALAGAPLSLAPEPGKLAGIASQQALVLSLADAFRVLGLLAIPLVPVVLRLATIPAPQGRAGPFPSPAPPSPHG